MTLLLPFLLFFSVSDHSLPPARLPHFRGVQTISTFHVSLKMSLRMFAQLWEQGPLWGRVLVLSAGKWSRPSDDWEGFVLSCKSPHHPAPIRGSFSVRISFWRLRELLKQLGAKPSQNRLGQISITVEGSSTHFQSSDLDRQLRTKWRKAFPSHLQLSSGPKHHTNLKKGGQPSPAPWGPCPAPEMPETPCIILEEPWPSGVFSQLGSPRTWAPCTSQANPLVSSTPWSLVSGALLERFAPFLSLEILYETWHKYLTSTRSEMPVLWESLLPLREKEEHQHLLLRAIISCSNVGVQWK